jgi:hypothetical protein
MEGEQKENTQGRKREHQELQANNPEEDSENNSELERKMKPNKKRNVE